MGLSMADVFNALQVNFGSLYVNDFNRFGRTWQVNVQAEARYRMRTEDLRRMYVRSPTAGSVPLAGFIRVRPVPGPLMIYRHNLYPAAFVNADSGVGTSSGAAIQALYDAAEQQLAPAMKVEFTELAFLQQLAGNTAMYAFLLAVILVFLVLAAQYESWALPLADGLALLGDLFRATNVAPRTAVFMHVNDTFGQAMNKGISATLPRLTNLPFKVLDTISYDPAAKDLSVEVSKAKATKADFLLLVCRLNDAIILRREIVKQRWNMMGMVSPGSPGIYEDQFPKALGKLAEHCITNNPWYNPKTNMTEIGRAHV